MTTIRHLSVGIVNIKRAEFKHEKVRSIVLQEFRKHSEISMKQERRERGTIVTKLHFFSCTVPQLYMTFKYFDGISYNLVNFVFRATSVWLFNYFQTFAKIKINFFD